MEKKPKELNSQRKPLRICNKWILKNLPVILFISGSLVSFFSDFIDLDRYYYYLNEILNTSLLVGIYIMVVSILNKLCWYNKVAAFGMILSAVVNLMFINSNEYDTYLWAYDMVISPILVVICLFLILKKI